MGGEHRAVPTPPGLKYTFLEQYHSGGYPQLTLEDVRACVRYVVDLVAAKEVHLREASL